MFAAYLGREVNEAPDDVIPARADLSLLPPTLVTTSEVDCLRAQALHFVDLARRAGAPVDHHDVDGVLHGYLNTVGDEPLADAALARHVEWLRGHIGS
jgi:acetyl esterase